MPARKPVRRQARPTGRKVTTRDAALHELRRFGLRYPGAHTKSPWPGHLDLAVNDKTFAYLSLEGEPLSLSCKLPRSSAGALLLPFASPTSYGLGKSGWVTARFEPGERPPLDMLKAWIDESYRAQAPKRLAAQLAPGREGASAGESAGAARKRR
jgi:predicted DNA-binding protein (MmcQ/YjbR family)